MSCAPPPPIPPSPAPKPQLAQAPTASASDALARLPLTPGATWPDLAVLESTLTREVLARYPAGPPQLVVDRFPLGSRDLIVARIEGLPAKGAAVALLWCGAGGAGPKTVLALRRLTNVARFYPAASRWTAPDGRFGLLLLTWGLSVGGQERHAIGWEAIRVDAGSLSTAAAGSSPAGSTIRFVPGPTGPSLVRCEDGRAAAAELDLAAGRFGPLRPSDLPCIPFERIEWLGPSDDQEGQEP